MPHQDSAIDKAIAESIQTQTFFYFWGNLNTPMKWIFVILILGAIIVGIIFLVKAWKKADETPKKIEEENTDKEF
jgi:hypothetical protein